MPGPPAKLAGRYRFVESIQAGAKAFAWIAEDEQSDRRVVASAIGAARMAALSSVIGVAHPHLCTVLDVIADPDPLEIPSERGPVKAAAVAVAEYAPGTTLLDQIKRGRLGTREAVELIVQIAAAAAALHDKGGAHGAISTRSVVVTSTGNKQPPVLSQLIAPTSGSYSSPERLRGAPPSSNDDAWALHATLYAALTGSVPFSGATKEELVKNMLAPVRRLETFGIHEPALERVLEAGFSRHPGRRPGVAELAATLVSWLATATSVDAPSAVGPAPLDDDTTIVDAPASLPDPTQANEAPLPSFPLEKAVESSKAEANQRTDAADRVPPRPLAVPKPSVPNPLEKPLESTALARESDPTLQEEGPEPLSSAVPPAPPSAAEPVETEPFATPVSVNRTAPARTSAAAALPTGAAASPKTRQRRTWLLVAAVAAALLAALAIFLWRRTVQHAPAPAVDAPERRMSPSRAAAADAAAQTSEASAPTVTAKAPPLAECVAAHLPPDTFRGLGADAGDGFAFLCAGEDLRGLASQLHRKIVLGGAGQITDGMKHWSSLGWFELPATAVVRRACCPPPSPVTLPPNQGPCKQLAEVVEEVARMPLREADAHTRSAMYGEAVFCMFYYSVKRPYRYKGHPQKNHEESFAELLRRGARAPAALAAGQQAKGG